MLHVYSKQDSRVAKVIKSIPPPAQASPKKERKYRPISPMKQSSERASSVSNDYNPSERDDFSQNDENFDHKIEKTEVKLVKIQKTASQIEQSKIHRRNDVSMSNTLQTI